MREALGLLPVLAAIGLAVLPVRAAQALEYPYAPYGQGLQDPQTAGWPLTDAERRYVLKPEHERRPGSEKNQHLPLMRPVTPAAGSWGGTCWLDTHAGLVTTVAANKGPIDILLVGDSITAQWKGQNGAPFNTAWQKHFGKYCKTVNIGVGGDKTQTVLWRLDHGGVEGIEPRLAVLLIGNNNMYFTPETGVEAADLNASQATPRGEVPRPNGQAPTCAPAQARTDLQVGQDRRRPARRPITEVSYPGS